MYRLLSSIPLDHLAANGESMVSQGDIPLKSMGQLTLRVSQRGKVLRIILALLNRSRTPDLLSEEVKSFWNMFSMIQFVQVSLTFRPQEVPRADNASVVGHAIYRRLRLPKPRGNASAKLAEYVIA